MVKGAETGIGKAAEKIQKGYQNIQKTQEEIDRLQVAYIQQKTAEIKQHVVEFSCGTAEKLKEIEESDVWQYLSSSVVRFVFGDYSDEDMTLLSFGGTLLAGFAGVDIPLDIRDLVYDVQHYGEDGISVGRLGIDVVALLPVISVVKNVKYADEVADAVKGVSDAVDGISDTGKVADDVLETTEDVIKGGSNSAKYSNWDEMKNAYDGTITKFINENKPKYSPDIKKWFDNGGTIEIGDVDGKKIWTYTSVTGESVPYIDGYIQFPDEYLNPTIKSIDIGEFTGDRGKDIDKMLEILEADYGITEIPDGYVVHHDIENGILQLVDENIHKMFTHIGGHSLYK